MDKNDFLAYALRDSRAKARRSQEYLALELGIARKTIQNWERGVSEPSIGQAIEWFHALDQNPLPYLFQYVHPEMEGINQNDDMKTLRESLMRLLSALPDEGVRELLFLFYGDHGSSPRAVLNMLTAHLHTQMRDRVTAGSIILKNYEIAEKKQALAAPNHIKPDKEYLRACIDHGEKAVIEGSETYVAGVAWKSLCDSDYKKSPFG